MKRSLLLLTALIFLSNYLLAQNSMTGDGFGGRGWYVPHNYQVGAYSAYTVCGDSSQLYGWGSNLYGEFGDGTNISSDTPVRVPGMTDVKFYSTGYVCAVIKKNNSAWVWGEGFSNGDISGFTNIPVQVLTDVKFVDCGISHAAFVKNDGTVWAAGRNVFGQLGNGTTFSDPVTTPVQMTGITNAVRAVCLGYNGSDVSAATIILLNDGTVKITGGQGWFTDNFYTIPTTLPELSDIVDIKGNELAAYALKANGDVYSFGKEYSSYPGSLGLGAFTGQTAAPTKINFPVNAAPIIALSANNDGTGCFALDENGKVFGWGANIRGELGVSSALSQRVPVLIDSNVIDIFCGENFSYILKADSSLWAAGQSGYGAGWGSIWMNLPNIRRTIFTQIDPTISPMNLCAPKVWGVVPIKLSNFTCIANGNNAYLNWQSAEETNARKYIVQYCNDGSSFKDIVTVFATGSNSKYNYIHQQVSGTAFYRLKMMDKDGSFTFSETRVVRFNNKAGFTIAPNPANDVVYVFTKSNAVIKSIQIVSIDGQVVKTLNTYNNGQGINISNLDRATYFLKVVYQNNEMGYGRVIKM